MKKTSRKQIENFESLLSQAENPQVLIGEKWHSGDAIEWRYGGEAAKKRFIESSGERIFIRLSPTSPWCNREGCPLLGEVEARSRKAYVWTQEEISRIWDWEAWRVAV